VARVTSTASATDAVRDTSPSSPASAPSVSGTPNKVSTGDRTNRARQNCCDSPYYIYDNDARGDGAFGADIEYTSLSVATPGQFEFATFWTGKGACTC
jgi:hypothetical protein